jgi:formamidopyrimidine-DNA glycosylase
MNLTIFELGHNFRPPFKYRRPVKDNEFQRSDQRRGGDVREGCHYISRAAGRAGRAAPAQFKYGGPRCALPMPELPDVTVYVEALGRSVVGRRLEHVRLQSPFVLRSVEPPVAALEGRTVRGVRRIGKRIVLEFEGELFAVIHLMIAGRFHWRPAGKKVHGKIGLVAFDFPHGTLELTEAGSKKRASLNVVRGEAALAALDPGGLEPLGSTLGQFRDALTRESHTLKRALTDPTLFSGIGNAYSDEILHRARLSPVRLTRQLEEDEVRRLHESTEAVLEEWIGRLRADVGEAFPEKVTAFRKEMAVHGRHGQPCPVCGSPIQRIVYAENELNYCATCQTGGRLLADRSLSRLLKGDWPRTLDELERRLRPQGQV